jgi:PKD repeat protein
MKAYLLFILFLAIFSLKSFRQSQSLKFSEDETSGYRHVTVNYRNISAGSFEYFVWNTNRESQRVPDKQDFVCTYKRHSIYAVPLSGKFTSGQSFFKTKYKYIWVYATQLPHYVLPSGDVTIDARGYITSCSVSDFNTSTYSCRHMEIPETINGRVIKGFADNSAGVFTVGYYEQIPIRPYGKIFYSKPVTKTIEYVDVSPLHRGDVPCQSILKDPKSLSNNKIHNAV